MLIDTEDMAGNEIKIGDSVAYMSSRNGLKTGKVVGFVVKAIHLTSKYSLPYKVQMKLRVAGGLRGNYSTEFITIYNLKRCVRL